MTAERHGAPPHGDLSRVTVTINGRKFRMACEDGQEAHLRRLASDFDQRIGRLRSGIVGMVVGGTIGLIAGYLRGRVETVLMGIVDILLAFPALILLIAIVAFLGANLRNVVLGISTDPRADVNGDGAVNVTDLRRVINVILGISAPTAR